MSIFCGKHCQARKDARVAIKALEVSGKVNEKTLDAQSNAAISQSLAAPASASGNTGMIIGIIIGVLLLLGGGIFIYMKTRK